MEKVVYLLGAGFSAPLGLPIISDFHIKAKRMSSNHESRAFKEAFRVIKDKISIIPVLRPVNAVNIFYISGNPGPVYLLRYY